MQHRKFAVAILVFLLSLPLAVQAQTIGTIQCGDIVEGEIIPGQSQTGTKANYEITFDDYSLEVSAGTRINLFVKSFGGTFNVGFILVDAGGNDVLFSNATIEGEEENLTDFALGSSNQILRIIGVRPGIILDTSANNPAEEFYAPNTMYGTAGRFFGAYEIRLGCTLRDGRVIEPGESADAAPVNTGGEQTQPAAPAFSGIGFVGLAPVDFKAIARLPLPAGIAMSGAVTPTGSEILGYTFEATEGNTLNLAFNRISGNLNLGLVVLLGDNQVVYQSSLINTETMNAVFKAPATGTYTVAMYRINLLPPATPEATAFQLQVTLE
jgi:hypothetical protein